VEIKKLLRIKYKSSGYHRVGALKLVLFDCILTIYFVIALFTSDFITLAPYGKYLYLFIFLFICGLFYSAVSVSYFIASEIRLVCQQGF
jgi:hypothetical protein